MIAVLLFLIPLAGGLAGFAIKNANTARLESFLISLLVLVVSVYGLFQPEHSAMLQVDVSWIPTINARFALTLDGLSQILCLLTALSFPLIFGATWNAQYSNGHNFYSLMLLSQAGLLGVFLASDALLFYFFWELALIPVYFLCSQWGGEKRIAATFKFFIYTFVGSLLMLVGILYLYFQTHDHSFSQKSFYGLRAIVSSSDQNWLFWLFFIAFAIKIPIFPFHTWQPDTYEQAPAAVTMVLSAIMVKMGVYGILRWLAPVLAMGTWAWGDTASGLCIAGMLYASLVAWRQDDLKRLVAYSSIAHMGLMVLAIFATNASALQGVMFQLFAHGINILGMWMAVDWIETHYHTRKMSELGGIARQAPVFAVFLVLIALANIALPLTNGFVGEFLMFNGIFGSSVTQYNIFFTVAGGLTIILSAVYTLLMLQKVLFGPAGSHSQHGVDISRRAQLGLIVLVVAILILGIFPKPMLEFTRSSVDLLLNKMNYKP